MRDTGIKVEVLAQGSAVTITGPNNERIEVTPGEQHLKIEYAGVETVTTSFELKKGQRRLGIKARSLTESLGAELENLPLTLTPPPERHKTESRQSACGRVAEASPQVNTQDRGRKTRSRRRHGPERPESGK